MRRRRLRAREVSSRDEAEIRRAEAAAGGVAERIFRRKCWRSYDRVAKSSRKTGIAEARAQECLGCHVKLRPQGME